MAQAAVALPNSTQPLASLGAAQPNVDELLAQLAGDEIDRLLAEADNGRNPGEATGVAPPPAPRSPSPVVQPIAESATATKASSHAPKPLVESSAPVESPTHGRPVTAAPASPTATSEAPASGELDMMSQLDDLFNQLESQQIAVPPPVASKSAPVVEAVPTSHAEPSAVPFDEAIEPASPHPQVSVPDATEAHGDELATAHDDSPHATETSAAERGALNLGEGAHEPITDAVEEPRVTWLRKVLETMNAPLINGPDVMREVAGKIALVTFFNAIAVLVYIYVFRKTH